MKLTFSTSTFDQRVHICHRESGALHDVEPVGNRLSSMAPSNPFNSIFQNTGTASGGNTGILGLNIFNYGRFLRQPTVGYRRILSRFQQLAASSPTT